MKRLLAYTVLLLALFALAGHAARAASVQHTLDSAAARGKLSPELHRQYSRDWSHARSAVRHLHGAARSNLRSVLSNTWSLARRHMLGARLTPVFLTIERNYHWFWRKRHGPAAYGARRTFGHSPVIFEFYPGLGWQIQPLGNFGKLNGLAAAHHTGLSRLRTYADALLPLAVHRKRFLAFEYYFPWTGGRPGWISGMATATGIAALGRVWKRTGDPRYRDAAEAMLGAFFAPPPWGIRLYRGHGRYHYLQYSQAPHMLVGNAFAQALIGLDDFVRITGSSRAKLALKRGLHQADARMRRFDTGAWSLYWRRAGTRHGGESDLHYHQLFEGFLAKLCKRFDSGPFCGLHERFARYETEPVHIGHLRVRRHGRILRIRVWTSKRGTSTLRLLHGRHTIRSGSLWLDRGTHVVTWPAPKRHRHYKLRLEATSLNGLDSARERTFPLH
jgi:D-glucuronyl C5-epimerase C-terminus